MSTNNLTIGEILGKTVPYLNEKGIPNPRLEADLMLAFVLDLPRVKLYSQWDRPLEPKEVQHYRETLVKRIQGTPLAYITGSKSFLSWDFKVNPAVLIPRPDTELLVEVVVDRMKNKPLIRGIDVGTGSGAVVIALAKLLPNSQWIAIDISQATLDVAKENAATLGVETQIDFIIGDLLEPILATESSSPSYDIIVSNPPYIPTCQINDLQPEVRQEPVLALDGGQDGLEIYRRLIPQSLQLLADGGYLIMEHGYQQRSPLEEICKEYGVVTQSILDLAGFERVLTCQRTVGLHA